MTPSAADSASRQLPVADDNTAIADEIGIGSTSVDYNPNSAIAAVSRYYADACKRSTLPPLQASLTQRLRVLRIALQRPEITSQSRHTGQRFQYHVTEFNTVKNQSSF
jgi:hypothetical protein